MSFLGKLLNVTALEEENHAPQSLPGITSLELAVSRGLSADIVKMAIDLTFVATKQRLAGGNAREWVVRHLLGRGIVESVARLAVELAFQQAKSLIDKQKTRNQEQA